MPVAVAVCDKMGEYFLDVVLQKKGPELFKELVRLYPLAEVEDYFKGGQWNAELLKMDIQVFWSHREEAGAPEPPPVEEVKVGHLPAGNPTPANGFLQSPVAAGLQVQPQGALTGAELQLMVNFANKHKLDPVRAKTMLCALPAPQRYAVIGGFAPKEAKEGEESDVHKQLEAFIAEKKSVTPQGVTVSAAAVTPKIINPVVTQTAKAAPAANGVAAATAPAAAPANVVAPKQPPPQVTDPNKRPRLMTPQPAAAGTVRPVVPGPVAAGAVPGPATIRPVPPKPGMPAVKLA